MPLDDPCLSAGWRVCERVDGRLARRWTDGAAKLPRGGARVVIDLDGEGQYWRPRSESLAASA